MKDVLWRSYSPILSVLAAMVAIQLAFVKVDGYERFGKQIKAAAK